MQKVIAEITLSIDGFIAGPGISKELPMGENGPLLHEWIFDKATDADRKWLEELTNNAGAVICGHRTYATAIEDAWEGANPFSVPTFVVCHAAPAQAVEGFVYITAGIEPALQQARQTAGDKNVWIMGGASIIQQYLKANAVDELRLHVAPVLLGSGTRLFTDNDPQPTVLENVSISETPGAVHGVWRINK
jgi:dihydrofolate reductase